MPAQHWRYYNIRVKSFDTLQFSFKYFCCAGLSSTENLLNRTLIRIILWAIAIFTLIGNSLVLLGRGILKDENKVPLNFIRSLAGSYSSFMTQRITLNFCWLICFIFYYLVYFFFLSPRPTLRDRVIPTDSGRHADGLLPIRHSHSGLAVPRSLSPVLASVDFIAGLYFRRCRGHDLNRGINDYSPRGGGLLAFSHHWCTSRTDQENSFHCSRNCHSFFLSYFLSGFSVAFSVHVNGALPMYSFAIWLHETQPEDSQN